MKNNIFKINNSLIVLALVLVFSIKVTLAITTEALPDNKVYNDFVVGPGKIEMELLPGQTGTFDLLISNRLGTEKTFTLSMEDFTGSDDPNQTVVLLGDDRGPYSLKDYIKISTNTIDLEHGKRLRIPVSVSVPKDASPGGLYGSVLVGTMSKNENSDLEKGKVLSTNPVLTRIGVLVFIRIKGEAKYDGKLQSISLVNNQRIISGLDGVEFNILFRNNGNVHLNPNGKISIKNIIGTEVGSIDVGSWFVMPQSLRFRQVSWEPKFLFGKYTATAYIDRGYGETKDQMSVSFWAIQWQIISIIFVAIVAVIVLIKRVSKKRRGQIQ